MSRKCLICGEPAGWWQATHAACRNGLRQAEAEIRVLLDSLLADGSEPSASGRRIREIASRDRVSEARLEALVLEAWECAADRFLKRGALSDVDDRLLADFARQFGMGQPELDRNGVYTRVIRAAFVRELGRGVLPKCLTVQGVLPFLLAPDEVLVWVFQNVGCFQDGVRSELAGAGVGMGFKVTERIYATTGTTGGRMVQNRVHDYLDTGTLAVTTRHVMFQGDAVAFRIPLDRIVSVLSDEGSVMVFQEDGPARTLVTGDGGFTASLIRLASRAHPVEA